MLRPSNSDRYLAANSPSISLEKGIGRIRPPRRAPSVSPSPSSRKRHKPSYSSPVFDTVVKTTFLDFIRAMIILIVVVVLFVTLVSVIRRWAPTDHERSTRLEHSTEQYKVSFTRPNQIIPYTPHPDDRFLSWLPHSGYHNQRVAFENALVLSYILNRTLLVPPVRFGLPIRFAEFDKLAHLVALSTKDGLDHCAHATNFIPRECIGIDEFVMVPWSALVNLHAIAHVVPIVERWDSSQAFLRRVLNISAKETSTLKDVKPYEFQFYDSAMKSRNVAAKYATCINVMEELSQKPPHSTSRLLQLGSLFGSARLRLANPMNRAIRRTVRELMVPTHPVILRAAKSISNAIPKRSLKNGEDIGYYGIHLRVGDGGFRVAGEQNARLLWYSLVVGLLGIKQEEAHKLEAHIFGWGSDPTSWVAPPAPLISPETPAPPLPHFGHHEVDSWKCLGRESSKSSMTVLNIPVFIATDARHPRTNSALSLFVKTLPCAIFLSDFTSHRAPLPYNHYFMPFSTKAKETPHTSQIEAEKSIAALKSQFNNPDSENVSLEKHLLPFVDALVVAKARAALGTPHSTFSRFTIDVLHQLENNREILERGR